MHFQLLPVVAALLAMTQAAPASSNLEARKSVNDCGDSTFENQSSSGSPLIADCQQITRNIAGGGTWTVGAGGNQRQLVQYGTCAFGAKGGGDINYAYIGNQDIIDLINSSIQKFAWFDKVGAKGEMACSGGTGLVSKVGMEWGLYHT